MNSKNPDLDRLLQKDRTVPVYFVYSGLNRLIKIGQSWNPGHRVKNLQTGAGELYLLAVTTKYTESELHERFSTHRESGEWYRAADDLVTFITGLTK